MVAAMQPVATRWVVIVFVAMKLKVEESAQAMAAEGKTKALTTPLPR